MSIFKPIKSAIKRMPVFGEYLANYYTRQYDKENVEEFSNLLAHEAMLADKVRVDSYWKAFQKYIKPGDVVIDLGTGTGILSFLASRSKPKKIYALDHSAAMLEQAKRLAAHNGIDCIEFIQCNSRSFDLNEKVDVIIHEQLGANLFDENMVQNVGDLRDRLLKPGGRIIPAEFELFLEPCKIKDPHHVPFMWTMDLHGIRFDCMKALDVPYAPGVKRPFKHFRPIFPWEVEFLMAEPEPVMSVNLMTSNPKLISCHLNFRKTITREGRMDGLCLYFRMVFDDENAFDTSCNSTRTHWRNALLRLESQVYREGDVIDFDMSIGDITDIGTWVLKRLDQPANTSVRLDDTSA
jgi:protein arginine N-methyltransferase 1